MKRSHYTGNVITNAVIALHQRHQNNSYRYLRLLLLFVVALVAALIVVGKAHTAIAQSLQVRVDRWLEVQQISGTVTFQRGTLSQTAQIGSRLQNIGDTLRTGPRSRAVLAIDTDTGTVSMSHNTAIQVQELQVAPNGGRLTRLRILGGQARFQIRPFSPPGSRLEIETPAGTSAVRGTEFGINVRPDGTTGVATLEGSVETEAQLQTVTVGAGQQTIIVPGESPATPTTATNDATLKLRWLTLIDDRTVRVSGQIDPINLLELDGSTPALDRNGRFDTLLPLPTNRRIEVLITTPAGSSQEYELAVPAKD